MKKLPYTLPIASMHEDLVVPGRKAMTEEELEAQKQEEPFKYVIQDDKTREILRNGGWECAGKEGQPVMLGHDPSSELSYSIVVDRGFPDRNRKMYLEGEWEPNKIPPAEQKETKGEIQRLEIGSDDAIFLDDTYEKMYGDIKYFEPVD